jgi:hypothetical protein
MCGIKGRDKLCNRCKDRFEEYQISREYQWDLEEEVEVWLRDPDNSDLALDILEKELRDTDLYEFFFGENRELVMDKVKANVVEQSKKHVTDTVDEAWWNDDDL